MAAGDNVRFEEATGYMFDGGWEAADTMKVMLITSAVTPTASDPIPGRNAGATTTFTEVSAGGGYTDGGETLATWGDMIVEVGGVMTYDDTGASVVWTQQGGGPTDARYAVVYNSSDTGLERATHFFDLGTTVDLTAGDLTITWNASGIMTAS